jgi:hypothetical protein
MHASPRYLSGFWSKNWLRVAAEKKSWIMSRHSFRHKCVQYKTVKSINQYVGQVRP